MAETGWNPEALSGTRLGSCFLEDPLSIGSMGAVFMARQERPRRYVAVKVIHRNLASDSEAWKLFLTRFQREADATAALDHANIVPIYEFGETGDVAYLVMPYLPDGSLSTLIEKDGPLALPQAITYLEQVAAALDYAHARGIVHRDVKPSNMLLHPDGRILLADFGIARPLNLPDLTPKAAGVPGSASNTSLTQAGSSMGTPEFMAPEQVRGGPISPATDTYALGIATYEMLCGETPFGGGDVTTVLRRQIVSPPPPIRTIRTDVPPRVEEVIFWALAKDPSDRPATAGDYARALRAATRKSTLATGVSWLRQTPSVPIGPRGPVFPGSVAVSGSGRQFPEPTIPLPHQVRPQSLTEVKASPGTDDPDDSSVTSGPGGIKIYPALQGEEGGGGYTGGGVPQWPTPQRGPNPKIVFGAVAGLAMAIVILIILAALLANTVQAVLTSPTPPAGIVSTNQAKALPTPTQVLATPTPTPPANWLSVSPTQLNLSCRKRTNVSITNLGPEPVQWQAGSPSFSVQLQPSSGSLGPKENKQITVSLLFGGIGAGDQGTITFTVTSGQPAGNPAEVVYIVSHCNGGG